MENNILKEIKNFGIISIFFGIIITSIGLLLKDITILLIFGPILTIFGTKNLIKYFNFKKQKNGESNNTKC